MFKLLEKSSGYLFSSIDFSEHLASKLAAARQEIDSLEANRLLNTSPHDLAKYLLEKYETSIPQLKREEWNADVSECKVDVRYDSNRWIDDKSKPFYIPGQRFDVSIPFEGNPELFYARANTGTLSPPRGKIVGNSLLLRYDIPHDTETDIRRSAEKTLDEIETHLNWLKTDLAAFTSTFPSQIASAIETRRNRLLANQKKEAALGIPIKKREGVPTTYAVPTLQRKVSVQMPVAASTPYVPEPTLDMGNYEHILNVCHNMAQVMERSPSAFEKMDEESLRQHFLVQLNGHFEGRATGETFNYSGKTDILIREDGKNIFIAECKFWRGPKQFKETIDQLLGYTAWRDTKTAILLFVKDTNLSTVLEGVQATASQHPNFISQTSWEHETGFRYVMHQNGDKNRELIMTVLAFVVPSKLG